MKIRLILTTVFLLMLMPLVALAQDPTAEPTVFAEATPDVATDPEPVPTIEVTSEPQEPPLFPGEIPETLPETAAEGLEGIAVLLAGLAGLAATAITDALKKLPYLSGVDKTKLEGPIVNLLAAVVSIVTGYLMGYLGVAAGFLDTSGVWQVILFSWPAAKAWFEVEQHRKTVPVLAKK